MKKVQLALLMASILFLAQRSDAAILEWLVDDGGNGHSYELIEDSLNWNDARDAAAARLYQGVNGHLVTLTSAQENQFLVNNFTLNHDWIGAFQFDKLAEPDGHWRWVTDEPFVYTNWNQVPPHFEPNESGIEDWAAFGTNIFAPDGTDLEGKWQDWKFFGDPDNRPNGYLVEYDSPLKGGPVVPEPASLFLTGFGLLGLAMIKNRGRFLING